jgi:hypothetical protein
MTVNNNISITVPGNTTTKTANQIGVEVGRQIQRTMARYG